MHFWEFPTKIAQKPWLHFFTNFASKAQKANPPNLAKPKHNQDQFLLQPNFWHLILDAFVTIPHQDCSKTTTSLFPQFCYQGTKTRPSDQTSLSQNPTKINSFRNQTLDTSFWMYLWQFPTKIAPKQQLHFFTNFATKAQKANPPNLAKPKPNQDQFLLQLNHFTPHFAYICDTSPPRLLKNHDFTFSPILQGRHKNPIHPTWLSQNPTKINSFCNQTFHTSFCIHLWHFTTKISQKPWLTFSPILLPRHRN